MLIRALIVLLLVLNLGVGLWWALRTPPAVAPAFEPDPQVPRLQLVALQTPSAATPATEPPAIAPSAIARCLSLGPFTDAAAAAHVRTQLAPQLLQWRPRREFTGTPDGWRVFLPLASIDQAEAAADKVAAAGFKDYYVIREGEQAGELALGLYGDETTARARVARLRTSGFSAQAEPTGAGPSQHWLDVAVAAGFDLADAQIGAAQRRTLDCRAFQQTP